LNSLFGVGSQVYKAVAFFDLAETDDKVNKIHSMETFTEEGTLQRTCFADFKQVIEKEHSEIKPSSVLVFGPRGVGKTTMVAAALKVRNIIVFSY
jgi:predicted AAA+ superfamily ATPase